MRGVKMSRSISQSNYNNFTKGLVTEATPLTFPENAAIIHENFEVEVGGRIHRRKGLEQVVPQTSGEDPVSLPDIGTASTMYLWKNVNGENVNITVVQSGTFLLFYSVVGEDLILIGERKVEGLLDDGTLLNFTPFGGGLIVGIPTYDNILIVTYNSFDDIPFNFEYRRLLIRDTFGVDLLSGYSVASRPLAGAVESEPEARAAAIYNARNSGWLVSVVRSGETYPEQSAILTAQADVDVATSKYQATRLKEIEDTANEAPSLHDQNLYKIPAFVEYDAPVKPTSYVTKDTDTATALAELNAARTALDTLLATETDPLVIFLEDSIATGGVGLLPALADNINKGLYSDTEDPSQRVIHTEEYLEAPVPNYAAPKGRFIIPALNQREGRLERWPDEVFNVLGSLSVTIGEADEELREKLPSDDVGGGVGCMESFNGRMFFGGFQGTSNIEHPMAPYILYSRVTTDEALVNKCYQLNDPTDPDLFQLLPDDGGTILIEGAIGIIRLIEYQGFLLVFASNGIWAIRGSGDSVFSALSQSVDKLSNVGCVSRDSIVQTPAGLLFWGIDGIYALGRNQYGTFETSNLTDQTIKSIFTSLPANVKCTAFGINSETQGKARWIYRTEEESRELIFDLRLQSFTLNTISSDVEGSPFITAVVETPGQGNELYLETVTDDFDVPVTLNDDVTEVVVNAVQESDGIPDVIYLTRTTRVGDPTNYTHSFSRYGDDTFTDWVYLDGVGIDAQATLLTGYLGDGDQKRFKQAPYVYFYLNKTETGYYQDENDVTQTAGQSSCLVQVQWDWTNSEASGRWSKPFQAYRHKRIKMYSGDVNETFDNGESMVITKNKVRGKGRVLSLLIKSEPGKDLDLNGWGLMLSSNNNV